MSPLDRRTRHALLAGGRRLPCCYERKVEHFLAFTSIVCTLICCRRVAIWDHLSVQADASQGCDVRVGLHAARQGTQRADVE